MSSIWRSARKFIYQRILHADDSPRNLALGVAIGVLIGFTPTMGLQTVIAIAIAALLRANKAAAVPMVWVTNPVTFVPVYGFCWWVGSLLTGGSPASRAAALERLRESGEGFVSGMFQYDFWAGLISLMAELGAELWIGCLVIGVLAAIPMYFFTRWGVTTYRVRRQARYERRMERRLRRRSARAARKMVPTGDPV